MLVSLHLTFTPFPACLLHWNINSLIKNFCLSPSPFILVRADTQLELLNEYVGVTGLCLTLPRSSHVKKHRSKWEIIPSTLNLSWRFRPKHLVVWASQVVVVVKNSPANATDIRDVGSISRWGRSPGGGHGYPLQYSCLEIPMDRGDWRATVHGFRKIQTRLNTHTLSSMAL